MNKEIRNEELKKEIPDTTQLPLNDAALEEATGGATSLIAGGTREDVCPSCGGKYRTESDESYLYQVCVLCGYRKTVGSCN